MILRSVMKHVRDQNWVAVGVDFIIVVVGDEMDASIIRTGVTMRHTGFSTQSFA